MCASIVVTWPFNCETAFSILGVISLAALLFAGIIAGFLSAAYEHKGKKTIKNNTINFLLIYPPKISGVPLNILS